ncbi:MAG: hypothetical protein EZS28_042875, partial [Streblomastix strix]
SKGKLTKDEAINEVKPFDIPTPLRRSIQTQRQEVVCLQAIGVIDVVLNLDKISDSYNKGVQDGEKVMGF